MHHQSHACHNNNDVCCTTQIPQISPQRFKCCAKIFAYIHNTYLLCIPTVKCVSCWCSQYNRMYRLQLQVTNLQLANSICRTVAVYPLPSAIEHFSVVRWMLECYWTWLAQIHWDRMRYSEMRPQYDQCVGPYPMQSPTASIHIEFYREFCVDNWELVHNYDRLMDFSNEPMLVDHCVHSMENYKNGN